MAQPIRPRRPVPVLPPGRKVVMPPSRDTSSTVQSRTASMMPSPERNQASPVRTAQPIPERTLTVTQPRPAASRPSYPSNNRRSDSISVPYIVSTDSINDGHRIRVGDTQSMYVCGAAGEATAVLPSVLWHPSVSSIQKLTEDVGDIDTFLQKELGWTSEHLSRALSPEQRDGAAKIIYGMKSGYRPDHDFLLADEAGFGKGRILMSVALWCKLNNRTPVVFTKYPSLFSNLWNDIQDIGATEELGRPFIINESVSIVDLKGDGSKTFGNISPKLHKETIQKSNGIPDGYGFILCTWSQLSVKDSPKIKYLKRVFENNPCSFFGDESHTAVIQSAHISINANDLKASAMDILDTSATSSRDIVNMSSYRNIYPWLSSMKSDLFSISEKHKLWISEFSVERAVGNGKMLRREMDMSDISLGVVYPEDEMVRRNSHIRDSFAHTVSLMANLVDAIKAICDEKNRKLPNSETKQYETTNFFTRLSLLSLQLEACLVSGFAAHQACEHLADDIKPLIVLDMTMETTARAIAEIEGGTDDDGYVENEDAEDDCDLARKPLTLHDLMFLSLERLMACRFGKDSIVISPQETPEIASLYNEVYQSISTFPIMPASPIDHVRNIIETEGEKRYKEGKITKPWKVGELSGRSAQIDGDRYVKRNEDRNSVISRYNRDDYDAVIATSAASTGGSMHHSKDFAADKRRSIIEAIGCRNPIDRKQMWGRISRRGNLSTAIYETLCSGTAYGICRMAMENAKAMRLNASVSGDRNNGLLMKGEDILSPVANSIAKDFLLHHPEIAQHLRIDMESQSADNEESWYVRKLFGRSMMLPGGTVNRILEAFMEDLQKKNSYATNLQVTEIGEDWEISDTLTLIEPGMPEDAGANNFVTGHVGIINLSREVPFVGHSPETLPELTENSQSGQMIAKLREGTMQHLKVFKPRWAPSVADALEKAKDTSAWPNIRRNACVVENERIDQAISIAEHLSIGKAFVMPDKFGEQRPGIITGIEIPRDVFAWKEYAISYVVPGDKQTYQADLYTMMDIPWVRYIADNAVARSRFTCPADGVKIEKMTILGGNEIRACVLASRIDGGRKVRYVDTENRERTGILVNKSDIEQLSKTRLMIPNAVVGYRLIRDHRATLSYRNSVGKELMTISLDPANRTNVNVVLKGTARDQKVFDRLRVVLAGITGQPAKATVFKTTVQNIGEVMTAITDRYNLTCASVNRGNILDIVSNPWMRQDIDYDGLSSSQPSPSRKDEKQMGLGF